MKLLKCTIYNFGKYHDETFTFGKDFNEIFLENGEGKTTLVSFLVAVFFGSKVGEINNLLKKYESIDYPNDTYGGEVIFLYKNEEYKLIHTFSKRDTKGTFKGVKTELSKKNSSFKVNSFDDDSPITYLFSDVKKPAEALLNTVIFSQETLTKESTDVSLNDLFDNQLSDIYDLNDYENVKEQLDDKLYSFKTKGKGSLRKEASDKLKEIKTTSKEKENRKNQIATSLKNNHGVDPEDSESISNKINEYKNEVSKVNDELKEIEERGKKSKDYQDYLFLTKNLEEREIDLNEAKEKLKGETLTTEIVDSLASKAQKIRKDSEDIKSLEAERNSLVIDGKYLDITEEKEKEIDNLYEDWKKEEEEASKNVLETSTKVEEEPTHKNSKKRLKTTMYILAALCVILLVVGIVLSVVVTGALIYGIILAVVGGLGTIGCIGTLIYLYKKKDSSSENEFVDEEYDKVLTKAEEKSQKELELVEFFKNIDITSTDLNFNYETFKKKLSETRENKNKYENYTIQIESLEDEMKNLSADISEAENKYGYSDSLTPENFCSSLRSLLNDINSKEQKVKDAKEALSDPKYDGFDKIDPASMRGDTLGNESVNLVNKRNDIDRNKVNLTDTYSQYCTVCNELEALKKEEEDINNSLNYYSEQEKFYGDCLKYLNEASDSIHALSYKPFEIEFEKFLDKEKGNEKLFSSYQLKPDEKNKTRITFNIKGKDIDSSYLSKGYQDYYKLAVRLSFLNIIYKGEKPFIILDDPFVNMDKDRLETVKKVVLDISKDYQIIYLCCHESRKFD